VELVEPDAGSTLVSFRVEGEAADVVERLREARVDVREIPGRDLVRASCGWWTSDEDVERLAAGLAG
jgi:selenocysteine lyase/cysteine desulfurase